jgi:hypothetical protein
MLLTIVLLTCLLIVYILARLLRVALLLRADLGKSRDSLENLLLRSTAEIVRAGEELERSRKGQ